MVGYETGDGESPQIGFIKGVSYKFLKLIEQGNVSYRDKDGEIQIDKMFTVGTKAEAKIYDSMKNADTEVAFMRNKFGGMHYVFVRMDISDEEAESIRAKRREARAQAKITHIQENRMKRQMIGKRWAE